MGVNDCSKLCEAVPTGIRHKTANPTDYIMEVMEQGSTLETLSSSTKIEFRTLESQVGTAIHNKSNAHTQHCGS